MVHLNDEFRSLYSYSRILKKRNVIKKIWKYGFKFKKIFNSISEELKIYIQKCYGPEL